MLWQERDPIFDPFGRSHVFFAALAIVLFFVDLISDAAVAARLKEEDALWSTLTLCLILVPAFIVNLFSIVWFHQDHEVADLAATVDTLLVDITCVHVVPGAALEARYVGESAARHCARFPLGGCGQVR